VPESSGGVDAAAAVIVPARFKRQALPTVGRHKPPHRSRARPDHDRVATEGQGLTHVACGRAGFPAASRTTSELGATGGAPGPNGREGPDGWRGVPFQGC